MIPNFDEFKKLVDGHDRVPVVRQLLSDGLTPVSAFYKIDDGQSACLFESVIGGEKVGRYSFLGVKPFLTISAFGNKVTVRRGEEVHSFDSENPLDDLRGEIAKIRVASVEGLPPFTGGAIGYAGYDVIRYVENLPNAPADDRGLPDMSFGFYDQLIIFDHVKKTLNLLVLADVSNDEPQAAYENALQQLETLTQTLQSPDRQLNCMDIESAGHDEDMEFTANFTQESFGKAVEDCVEYIKAGDIFQVVISQRLQVEIECDPFEIYRTLRVINPSPFMFLLREGGATLVGSSPEIMCRVVDGLVTVRPLAGTRRRGRTNEEDLALEEELINDPKERAEHVMLVDLGRNDVGRVAQFGSIQIPDVMIVERYSHVMHISSTVTGQLRDDCDSFDALAASLPAGTVSGAPKVRAMEIIDEMEPHRRGPYAGAVGYIDFNGNMDTCIALRTMVIKDKTAYLQAGAGIVADSSPKLEYEETLNKARVLLRTIEVTENRTAPQPKS